LPQTPIQTVVSHVVPISPHPPIPRISQITVPTTPQIFVPHTTQEIPKASAYQIFPMVHSIPYMPIREPVFRVGKTPFQGQAYRVPRFQGQVFQSLPFQVQTFRKPHFQGQFIQSQLVQG